MAEDDAFFSQPRGKGRHAAGCDPSNFRVMGPTRDKKGWPLQRLIIIQEDGADDGQIWEVGTAQIGIVRQIRFPWLQMGAISNQASNRFTHGSEVNWDVGGIHDQIAVRVKKGAAVVEPLFHVDA